MILAHARLLAAAISYVVFRCRIVVVVKHIKKVERTSKRELARIRRETHTPACVEIEKKSACILGMTARTMQEARSRLKAAAGNPPFPPPVRPENVSSMLDVGSMLGVARLRAMKRYLDENCDETDRWFIQESFGPNSDGVKTASTIPFLMHSFAVSVRSFLSMPSNFFVDMDVFNRYSFFSTSMS